jgi:iron(III) transport system permease protein
VTAAEIPAADLPAGSPPPRFGKLDGRAAPIVLIGGLAVALAVFALLPTGRLLLAALTRQGGFAPDAVWQELVSTAALRALGHSLETGVISAAIALAVGLAAALAVTLTDLKGRKTFAFLYVLSMMMAPQVVALAFIDATGTASPLLNTLGLAPPPGTPNPLRSAGGIIFVLALHHSPLAFVLLRAGLRQIPRELAEAAEADGASRWQVVRLVILPLLRGHLIAAGLLCFVAAIGNFGIPALLGLPVNYLTLTTLIYRRLSSIGPSVIGDAASLALYLMLLTGVGVVAARRLLPGDEQRLEHGRGLDGLWRAGRAAAPLGLALAGLIGIALVVPIVSLLAAALVPTYGVALSLATVTLDNFAEVLLRQDAAQRAFVNSFLFAAAAAIGGALMAVPIAYASLRHLPRQRALIEGLFEIPYALPGIVLAVAAILLFLKPLPLVGISLYGTAAIIVFAYLARFLPLAIKPVAASLAQLDPSVEEAASLCGAGTLARIRYIIAPAVAPAMTAGALLVFLIAFNELTVSALLWSRGTETLGVVLFGLEEAGLASAASALAIAATAVVALTMLLLDRLGTRLPEGALPWR